jgi:biopolymer transport protein ExbD
MRMPTPARVWVSLLLICAGIVLFPAYRHWFATRTWVALDTPISLAPGHVRTGDFCVNIHTIFRFQIDLPGYDDEYWRYPDCEDYKVIQTRWWLSSEGRVTSTWEDFWDNHWAGLPHGPVSGSYLGAFESSPGRYDLDVEIAPGASCLQRFHPHLRVYADDSDYAGGGWIFATAFLASCLLAGAGGGLLLVSWTAPIPARISRGESLAIFETLRARRESARRRPLLMGPASVLPTVAYFYATTFFVLFLAMAPFQLSRSSRSAGIPARLLRAEVTRASFDQPATGLLVYVDRSGRLYLNSKPVTPRELQRTLEGEFALRADWSVYVEGDPNVTYQTVVGAMDLVRTAHGKVIILTPAMRSEAEAARH